MFYRHPDPDALWSTGASGRLWERRRDDADFGVVRIGLGPQELATPLIPPQTRPVDELEPLCALALRRFVATYSVVPDLPVAMALRGFTPRLPARRRRRRTRAGAARCWPSWPPSTPPTTCWSRSASSDGPPSRAGSGRSGCRTRCTRTRPTRSGQCGCSRPSVAALEAMLDDVLANRPRFNPTAPVHQVGGPHVLVVIDGGDRPPAPTT